MVLITEEPFKGATLCEFKSRKNVMSEGRFMKESVAIIGISYSLFFKEYDSMISYYHMFF